MSAAACEAYRRDREAEAFFNSSVSPFFNYLGTRARVVMPPRSSASGPTTRKRQKADALVQCLNQRKKVVEALRPLKAEEALLGARIQELN